MPQPEKLIGGKKGICLLRSLMNWEIIIQHSTTTEDPQIHSRKYFKERGLSEIPRRQEVGVRGSRQGKWVAGMILGEHPGVQALAWARPEVGGGGGSHLV